MPRRCPCRPVTADDAGRVVIVDRPGAVQTQLLIGRTGPDRREPIWPALVVGTYCLGGTLTSRLDRVLREEKGYTYGVRAFAQVLRSPAPAPGDGASAASLLAMSGAVDTASTGPALADLQAVLRTLATEGLTDAERDLAVQNLVLVAPLRYETAGSRRWHAGGPGRAAPARRLPGAAVPATRRDEHQREATAAVVAAFPADRLITVLVGDAAQIKEPIEALGIGDVSVVAS